MRLYEIDAGIKAIADSIIDYETGEINTALEEQLNSLEVAREIKVLNIGKVVLTLQAEVEAFDEAIKKMGARKATVERQLNYLKSYLAGFIPGENFSDAEVKISWLKSTSVQVIDESAVPDEFMRIIPESKSVDKTEIGKALKAGKNVSGCVLQRNQNIQIK